jgi:DsbC/DsbD-like thiol-disulfide interchange protein
MTLPVPFRAAALAVAAACLIAGSARADDASPWIKDTYSQVRLIAGSRSGTAFLGGIALQLQPGWKTYWRTPGDSGVPPRFDFSKSENVESVTILWPAPMRFPDGAGGVSLGYSKQVLLPLRIVAKHADKPVTLRAAINYAVCDKLCVPVEASAELTFTSVASTEDSAIAAALDTVPKPARIGDATPLAIRDVRREGANTVVVDVIAPREAGGKEVDLFVEGPTPDWALPVPKLVKREANGLRRFSFNLEGLPPGASATGAVLKFTLTGPSAAYEYTAALP